MFGRSFSHLAIPGLLVTLSTTAFSLGYLDQSTSTCEEQNYPRHIFNIFMRFKKNMVFTFKRTLLLYVFFSESHCFSSDYAKWELVRDKDIVVTETVNRINVTICLS